MSKGNPFGGGRMPDLNQLMKQAQKLQADAAKAQEELVNLTADGAAGGAMVTATVNGHHELLKLTIDKAVVDPSDIGMLQDLITAAVNQANAKVGEMAKTRMNSLMGGMQIPGM